METPSLRDNLIVGLGNPLLDISAVVNEELLKKYELKPNDAILAEDKHMSLYQELVEQYDAEYIAGGSVQNSFRVAQWILRRPQVSLFFGCIGKDEYGRILEKQMQMQGVNAQYQRSSKNPTGTCAVLITGTQRSLCANLAAANDFSREALEQPSNVELLNQTEYVYVSGFFFTASFESVQYLCRTLLTSRTRTFLMNLSAPFVPMFYKDNLEEVLPLIDVLFGNETEAKALGKVLLNGDEDLVSIGKQLTDWRYTRGGDKKRVVIFTQGSDPVLLFADGCVREFPVSKLTADEIVDTNGAGDAFVGGFLAQFVQHRSLDTCIECGIWAAGEIIKRSGCTFEGEPTFRSA